jgi:hypothetical protein
LEVKAIMRNKIALLGAAAAAFGLWPFAGRLGPIVGSLALLALGIMLSIAASATIDALAASGGAIGALVASLAWPASPAAAGAVLVGLAYAERTLRVRGGSSRLAHVGSALASGALAATITSAYAGASPAIRAVAACVAAVLIALPLFVEADDPVAHALDGLAEDVGEEAGAPLREGAALRRHVDERLLDSASVREVRASWRALVRLGEARARLALARQEKGSKADAPSAVAKRVDQRIRAHVDALRRAYLAADTAHAAEAAEATAGKQALEAVEATGEKLEATSEVLISS